LRGFPLTPGRGSGEMTSAATSFTSGTKK
jgi:hypothetical protein